MWSNVGRDAMKAAQSVKLHPRSCVSRAYYAAYARVTQSLVDAKGVAFPAGREGPNHKDLPDLIENHLVKHLGRAKMKEMKAAVRRLYAARLDADYSVSIQTGPVDAIKALQDASWIMRELDPRLGEPR